MLNGSTFSNLTKKFVGWWRP